MTRPKKKAIPLTFVEQQAQTQTAIDKRNKQRAEREESTAGAQAAKAGRQAENASLRTQGAKIYEDDAGNMLGGRRFNCFTTLLRGKEVEAKAVSWLEDLIRAASGESAQDRPLDYIRGSTVGAPGQYVTQRMVDASVVLKVVEAGLRPWEAQLLFDLLKPDEALLTRWRAVVQRVTGETDPQAQGSRVRAACEGLAFVRSEVDRMKIAA